MKHEENKLLNTETNETNNNDASYGRNNDDDDETKASFTTALIENPSARIEDDYLLNDHHNNSTPLLLTEENDPNFSENDLFLNLLQESSNHGNSSTTSNNVRNTSWLFQTTPEQLHQEQQQQNEVGTVSEHYVNLDDVHSTLHFDPVYDTPYRHSRASSNNTRRTRNTFQSMLLNNTQRHPASNSPTTSSPTQQNEEYQAIPLNKINTLNILSFILNLTTLFTIYLFPNSIFESMIRVQQDNQSLLTPTQTTNLIWIPIYVLDGLYTYVQYTTMYRATVTIQQSIGIWFVYSNIIQSITVITYSLEHAFISFVLSIYILLFHIIIIASFYFNSIDTSSSNNVTTTDSVTQYWKCHFPFLLKTGYLIYTVALLFMEALVQHSESAQTQLTSCHLILVIFGGICVFSLQHHDYVIPSVVIWSLVGVYFELKDPDQEIIALFDGDDENNFVIGSFRDSCLGSCTIVLTLMIPRLIAKLVQRYFVVETFSFEHLFEGSTTALTNGNQYL